jgi:hypothetical protein
MDQTQYISLNRKAILLAMISAAFPAGAFAAAGKVEFASGGAALQGADGSSKVLTKGMEVNQGDTILTGGGRAQVRFTDGGYFSFQPNTEFKVEEYNFNGKQDGSEKGFFKLLRGGLRAVTGFVGRENRPAYRLGTPVATIGIRGTYYLAEFQEKLKAHVGQGSIYIFNDQGDIILFSGQSADVEPGKAPTYSDEEMTLGAKGPEGGQPAQGEQEQQAQNQNNDVFRVSEQYNDNGTACLAADCGISSTVANLNGIGATGTYHLDNSVENTGGGAGWTSKVDSASITAYFGDYTMAGNIDIKSSREVNGGCGPFTLTSVDSFSVSGDILPSGSFGLSGSSSAGGTACYSGCTMNVVGLFNGTQAEKANIGYVINGVDNFAGGTGQIQGTAGIIADPPPSPLVVCGGF